MTDKPSYEELERKILELEAKIAEFEKTEIKLRNSEKKFRELAELLPETIYEFDMEMKITFVNHNALEQFGYTREEFESGLSALNMVVPEDRPRATENIKKILNGNDLGLTEYTALRKDGATFSAMMHSTLILDRGMPMGVRGFLIDTTEKKNMEAQLRQAQKMEAIGTLTGGVAHDFNNILSIIVANTELAMNRIPDDHPAKKRLENVIDSSFRARDVVGQLLAFSRSKEKEKFPLNISFMVKESLKLLRTVTPENIKIHQDIRYKTGKILSDPAQINQLMVNLCMNAFHAMEDKNGVLEVKLMNIELDEEGAAAYQLTIPGQYVNLLIKDTGSGIDPELKNRIFELYFSTRGTGKGSGSGLSVVCGIVKENKGGIKFDSTLGKGTCVSVVFPIIEDLPKIEKESKKTATVNLGTILVVDDEELILEVAQFILENLGYQVKSTPSPVKALEMFRETPSQFHLVITDASMPQMTGTALTKEILKIRPEIPVVICTGNSANITKEDAEHAGAKAFLMKPFKRADLEKALHKAMGKI